MDVLSGGFPLHRERAPAGQPHRRFCATIWELMRSGHIIIIGGIRPPSMAWNRTSFVYLFNSTIHPFWVGIWSTQFGKWVDPRYKLMSGQASSRNHKGGIKTMIGILTRRWKMENRRGGIHSILLWFLYVSFIIQFKSKNSKGASSQFIIVPVVCLDFTCCNLNLSSKYANIFS